MYPEASRAAQGTSEGPLLGPALREGDDLRDVHVGLRCRVPSQPSAWRLPELLAAGSGHCPGFWVPERQETRLSWVLVFSPLKWASSSRVS